MPILYNKILFKFHDNFFSWLGKQLLYCYQETFARIMKEHIVSLSKSHFKLVAEFKSELLVTPVLFVCRLCIFFPCSLDKYCGIANITLQTNNKTQW